MRGASAHPATVGRGLAGVPAGDTAKAEGMGVGRGQQGGDDEHPPQQVGGPRGSDVNLTAIAIPSWFRRR